MKREIWQSISQSFPNCSGGIRDHRERPHSGRAQAREPGFHTLRARGYGFRARRFAAPRNASDAAVLMRWGYRCSRRQIFSHGRSLSSLPLIGLTDSCKSSSNGRVQSSPASKFGVRLVFLEQGLVAVAAYLEHLLKEEIIWNLNYGAAVLAYDDKH